MIRDMETEITQTNYLSDKVFRVVAQSIEGEILDPAKTWLKVYLRAGDRVFAAVNDPAGENINCEIDGNALLVTVPGKRLGHGKVEFMFEVREIDDRFADGYLNTYSTEWKQTNIIIV